MRTGPEGSGERGLVSWEGGSQRQTLPTGVKWVGSASLRVKLRSEAQEEAQELFLRMLRDFYSVLRTKLRAEVRTFRKCQ